MLIGEDSFNILYNDSENNDLDFLKFDFTYGNNILNLQNFDNYPNKSSIIYIIYGLLLLITKSFSKKII
jgi:hypothetical protein